MRVDVGRPRQPQTYSTPEDSGSSLLIGMHFIACFRSRGVSRAAIIVNIRAGRSMSDACSSSGRNVDSSPNCRIITRITLRSKTLEGRRSPSLLAGLFINIMVE